MLNLYKLDETLSKAIKVNANSDMVHALILIKGQDYVEMFPFPYGNFLSYSDKFLSHMSLSLFIDMNEVNPVDWSFAVSSTSRVVDGNASWVELPIDDCCI
jgi:hypothetical protein